MTAGTARPAGRAVPHSARVRPRGALFAEVIAELTGRGGR